MLTGKKLIFTANTSVNDTDIAKHTASLNLVTNELVMGIQRLDPEACKEHREEVRSDVADFEDFVYDLQEKFK